MLTRSEFIKLVSAGAVSLLVFPVNSLAKKLKAPFTKADFGTGFSWGTATGAYQIEGAWNLDGKGPSIWDTFTHHKGNIKDKTNGDIAIDFYHRYPEDLALLKSLNFDSFRFSISWPRVLPAGTGKLNQKGADFYNRVIDKCLELKIEPWVNLYHWDLPQALEDKGGWTNRDIVSWFSEYAEQCAKLYGDRVKKWLVLNEPTAFTTFGYLTGLHAPGHIGLHNFLSSVHHAVLCQAEGGRVLKSLVPSGKIGSTFSCSHVDPKKAKTRFYRAVKRLDVVLNRLFIEPSLGMGYPFADLPFLEKINKYVQPGDDKLMKFDFDFIGLQNYFRVVGRPGLTPFIWAGRVKPDPDKDELTEMGWEVFPEGIYEVLKQFAAYPIKEFVITENGAAFKDSLDGDHIHDKQRIDFFTRFLQQVLRAKNDGVNVTGYFVWTFIDNFEWAEGFRPRFGIVYDNFATQARIVKDSGLWFKEFLK